MTKFHVDSVHDLREYVRSHLLAGESAMLRRGKSVRHSDVHSRDRYASQPDSTNCSNPHMENLNCLSVPNPQMNRSVMNVNALMRDSSDSV